MGLVLDKCCAANDSSTLQDNNDIIFPHAKTQPQIQNTRASFTKKNSKIGGECKQHPSLISSQYQNEILSPFQRDQDNKSSRQQSPLLSNPSQRQSNASLSSNQQLLNRFVHEDVRSVYHIGKEIGFGKFGIVRLVAKKSYEKKRFALKSMARDKLNADILQLEKEFEILRTVDHPNIINFYEMYVDEEYCHLVTEFCGGGELFEQIIERGKFYESSASKIIKQILSAIKHLHDRGICHRDLKPENILFESKSKDAQIKLIDFGLAKYYSVTGMNNQTLMKTRIGTPYYMAPEVLEGAYNESCDMWSIGVITYCLLCGYPPFNADNDQLLFRKIKLCDYEFHMPDWTSVSEDAKDFIRKLLQPNQSKRMTPEQALQHKWIKNAPREQISPQVLSRLALFKKPNQFQKEILLLLSALLNGKELKEIRETFAAIDSDSSGTISIAELCEAYKKIGVQLLRKDVEVDDIMKKVDFDENGEINYSEFISGALDRNLLSKENLWKVFKYLDTSGNEVLTYDSLKQSFQRKGDFDINRFNIIAEQVNLSPSSSHTWKQVESIQVHSNPTLQLQQNTGIDFNQFCDIMGLYDQSLSQTNKGARSSCKLLTKQNSKESSSSGGSSGKFSIQISNSEKDSKF